MKSVAIFLLPTKRQIWKFENIVSTHTLYIVYSRRNDVFNTLPSLPLLPLMTVIVWYIIDLFFYRRRRCRRLMHLNDLIHLSLFNNRCLVGLARPN